MKTTEQLFETHKERALSIARHTAFKLKLSYHDRCSIENAALMALWTLADSEKGQSLNGQFQRYAEARVRFAIYNDYANIYHDKALLYKRNKLGCLNAPPIPKYVEYELEEISGEEDKFIEFRFEEMIAWVDKESGILLRLKFKDNLSYAEISRRMGIGLTRLHRLISKALSLIKEKLGE